MNTSRSVTVALPALTAATVTCGIATAGEGSFYKGPALFSTRPDEKRSVSSIDRFGPVGMGIELHQPAFVMKIKNIEEGSPAAATGKHRFSQPSRSGWILRRRPSTSAVGPEEAVSRT